MFISSMFCKNTFIKCIKKEIKKVRETRVIILPIPLNTIFGGKLRKIYQPVVSKQNQKNTQL